MRSLAVAVIAGLVSRVQCQIDSCGEMCFSNMLAKAGGLGCSYADATCICHNSNFINGLLECVEGACSQSDVSAVVSYSSLYCASTSKPATADSQSTTTSPASITQPTITITTGATSTATISEIGSSTISFTTSTLVGSLTNAGPSSSISVSQSIVSTAAPSSIVTSTPSPATSATQAASNAGLATGATPSPATSATQAASNAGLATGAKAGIGIGVAIFVISALLLIVFFSRMRKRQHRQGDQQDLETVEGSAAQQGHEMITSANTHEMDAKLPENYQINHVNPDSAEESQELEAQDSWPGHPITLVNPDGAAELDALNADLRTKLGTDQHPGHLSELGVSTYPKQEAEGHSLSVVSMPTAGTQSASIVSMTQASPNEELEPTISDKSAQLRQAESSISARDSENKVEALRKRMEKIREDKERLQKIQALKELEDELQAELLMEQKKGAGI